MSSTRVLAYGALLGSIFGWMGLTGCIALAAPMVIKSMKGSETSTATVIIDESPADVYAQALATIDDRGYTMIERKDDANFFIEATRKGKNATFQAIPLDGDETQAILTIENDEDAQAMNQALQGLVEVCSRLGVQCQQ